MYTFIQISHFLVCSRSVFRFVLLLVRIFPNGADDATGEDQTEHFKGDNPAGNSNHNGYSRVEVIIDGVPAWLKGKDTILDKSSNRHRVFLTIFGKAKSTISILLHSQIGQPISIQNSQ